MSVFCSVAKIWTDETLLWMGLLLVFLVVGVGAVHLLRRYLRSGASRPSGPPLTLTQVREMRERGEISEKEYEALRRTVMSVSKPPGAGGPAQV